MSLQYFDLVLSFTALFGLCAFLTLKARLHSALAPLAALGITGIWFTLAGGVVTLALGLFALLRPDFVQWVLPVVFGVFLLVDGAAREQSAWQLVRRKGQRWWVLFVLGFVTGIAGTLLILQPFSDWPVDSIWLSGLLLIIEGVLNAGCTLYTALLLHDLDKAAEAPAPTDDGEAPADPDPSDPQS